MESSPMNEIANYKTMDFACFKGSMGSILVEGPDAWDFLNRITTRKFTEGNLGESLSCALLTGKSEIQCLFQAWNRDPQRVELFPLVGSFEPLLQFLDKMHFSEKIELKIQDRLTWIELRGQSLPFAQTNKVVEENIGGKQILIVPTDNWAVPGVWMGTTEPEDLMAVIKMKNMKIVEAEEFGRIKEYFGFPSQDGFANRYQILEMGLERFIDRNKGCYPGQEVVEKIYTYGKPAKRLVRVRLKCDESEIKKISSDQDRLLYSDKLEVGSWSRLFALENGEFFSLGVVQRGIVEKGLSVTFGSHGPTGHIELVT